MQDHSYHYGALRDSGNSIVPISHELAYAVPVDSTSVVVGQFIVDRHPFSY